MLSRRKRRGEEGGKRDTISQCVSVYAVGVFMSKMNSESHTSQHLSFLDLVRQDWRTLHILNLQMASTLWGKLLKNLVPSHTTSSQCCVPLSDFSPLWVRRWRVKVRVLTETVPTLRTHKWLLPGWILRWSLCLTVFPHSWPSKRLSRMFIFTWDARAVR